MCRMPTFSASVHTYSVLIKFKLYYLNISIYVNIFLQEILTYHITFMHMSINTNVSIINPYFYLIMCKSSNITHTLLHSKTNITLRNS